jgi:hypothetical protein
LAEFLFGHNPGARPLPVEEFVGPLAERAPDGSILITDAGTRWFFNELARKLGKPVIEDLLATAAAQAEIGSKEPETFSFGRDDEKATASQALVANAAGKLDEHGATKMTAHFDPEKGPPHTEWVGISLVSYTEALRDGFPNATVKVVVTLTPAPEEEGS